MDFSAAEVNCTRILTEVSEAVIVDQSFLENILTAVIADGHVLLEDVPGTGKTLTARILAESLGLSFSRIQFTPDMLPADVTGSNVYNEQTGEFEFRKGPLFANIVLADEVNRAPPKTQAALLESMGEGQVTIDGETYALPAPFIVLATQNPVEQQGTFELPEAQLDRFWIKESIGYPDREGETTILDRRADREAGTPSTGAVLSPAEVSDLQTIPEQVTVDQDLRYYMTDISQATRDDNRVEAGVSPRGTQRLFELARARAVLKGRDYVIPADIQDIGKAALAHRLVLTPETRVGGTSKRNILGHVIDQVDVPKLSEQELNAE